MMSEWIMINDDDDDYMQTITSTLSLDIKNLFKYQSITFKVCSRSYATEISVEISLFTRNLFNMHLYVIILYTEITPFNYYLLYH